MEKTTHGFSPLSMVFVESLLFTMDLAIYFYLAHGFSILYLLVHGFSPMVSKFAHCIEYSLHL